MNIPLRQLNFFLHFTMRRLAAESSVVRRRFLRPANCRQSWLHHQRDLGDVPTDVPNPRQHWLALRIVLAVPWTQGLDPYRPGSPTRPTSLSGPDLGSTTNLLAHLLVSISELKSKLKSELKPWTVDAQHHPQEGRNICISFISLSSLQKAINSRRRAKLWIVKSGKGSRTTGQGNNLIGSRQEVIYVLSRDRPAHRTRHQLKHINLTSLMCELSTTQSYHVQCYQHQIPLWQTPMCMLVL